MLKEKTYTSEVGEIGEIGEKYKKKKVADAIQNRMQQLYTREQIDSFRIKNYVLLCSIPHLFWELDDAYNKITQPNI